MILCFFSCIKMNRFLKGCYLKNKKEIGKVFSLIIKKLIFRRESLQIQQSYLQYSSNVACVVQMPNVI